MELLLNALWLAVAFAAFALCARGESDRRRIVVTACLVALLFPIISISDDLAPSGAALNETTIAQRAMAAAAQIIVALALAFVAFLSIDESFVLPDAPALALRTLRGPPRA